MSGRTHKDLMARAHGRGSTARRFRLARPTRSPSTPSAREWSWRRRISALLPRTEPNGPTFRPLTGGDGHNAAVNDKTLSGHSAIYTSAHLSALTRWTVNASGIIVTQTVFDTKDINFDSNLDFTDCSKGSCLLPIPSKMVLNKVYPTMMAFGTNYAYTTADTNAASDKLVLTNLGSPFSTITPGVTDNEITALAYGTSDNPNALLAGSNSRAAFILARPAGQAPESPPPISAARPRSVVFDDRAMPGSSRSTKRICGRPPTQE